MSQPISDLGLPTSADAWRCVLCHAVVVAGNEEHGCAVERRIREIVREEMSKVGKPGVATAGDFR